MAGPANVGAEPLSPRPRPEGIEPEPRRQMRRRPPDGSSEQMGDDDPDHRGGGAVDRTIHLLLAAGTATSTSPAAAARPAEAPDMPGDPNRPGDPDRPLENWWVGGLAFQNPGDGRVDLRRQIEEAQYWMEVTQRSEKDAVSLKTAPGEKERMWPGMTKRSLVRSRAPHLRPARKVDQRRYITVAREMELAEHCVRHLRAKDTSKCPMFANPAANRSTQAGAWFGKPPHPEHRRDRRSSVVALGAPVEVPLGSPSAAKPKLAAPCRKWPPRWAALLSTHTTRHAQSNSSDMAPRSVPTCRRSPAVSALR